MILLKLIAPILIVLITSLQIALDYKWHDKRTRSHRRVRRALLYVLGVTALVTILIVIGDNRTTSQMQTQLGNLQDTIQLERGEAARRDLEAKNERSKLLERLSELHFEVSSDETFRPLESQLRQIALNALKSFIADAPESELQVSVHCEKGSSNRQLVAHELVKLLKEAEVNTQGPKSQMTFSKGILPAIRVNMNPDDEKLARKLVAAITPMFRTKFSGVRDKEIKSSQIFIYIFGEPLFNSDGSVAFK